MKCGNQRGALQNGPNALALKADATAMDDTNCVETVVESCLQIGFYGGGDVAWRECVQIENIFDGEFDRIGLVGFSAHCRELEMRG